MFILGGISGLVAAIFELLLIFLFPKGTSEYFNQIGPKSITDSLAFWMILATVIFAAIEEILKIYVVKWFAYDKLEFNQVVDGAILGVSAGLGFATLENLGYFTGTLLTTGIVGLFLVFIVRFLASTLLHALTTGISGYYLGKAKFSTKKFVFKEGLIAAILIHATFNILILTGSLVGLLLDIFLLIGVFIFLMRKIESSEAQTIWKLVYFRRTKSAPSTQI